jgi:hypothetical protein
MPRELMSSEYRPELTLRFLIYKTVLRQKDEALLLILQGTVALSNLSLDTSKPGRLCNIYQLFSNCEKRPHKGLIRFRGA